MKRLKKRRRRHSVSPPRQPKLSNGGDLTFRGGTATGSGRHLEFPYYKKTKFIESRHGTGRTTRQVTRAIEMAKRGETIFFYVHNYAFAEYCWNIVLNKYRCVVEDCQRVSAGGLHFKNGGHFEIHSVQNKDEMYRKERGMRNVTRIVDHAWHSLSHKA